MKKARTLDTFCCCSAIGIDVAKRTIEVVGLDGETVWHTEIKNTATSIERLATVLSEGHYGQKSVCESTGHYHLLLGLILARYKLDLRIINPLQSSKHQKARIRKTKTDCMDGYVLASMCVTERDLPEAADLQAKHVLARLKQGQLHALDKQLQRLTRSVATYTETYVQLGFEVAPSAALLQQSIAAIKAARKQLQKEFDTLLLEALTDKQELDKLCQLPGYSPSVASLVATVFNRHAPSSRSWVAYAGMDVSIKQSGTWRGRGKLTKRGNSYLRKRLYHAAWGAVMNYERVKVYYDQLKTSGRNHVEALCIIARKLLRIAYTILVKGKDYDANIAFAY